MQRKTMMAAVAACLTVIPVAQAEILVGIRESDYRLISFDSTTPGVITAELALTLPAGISPTAIDYSDATHSVYIVGRGPTAGECQLYRISTANGSTTPVGSNRFSCSGVATNDVDLNPSNGNVRFMGGATVFDVNIDGVVIQLPNEVKRVRANSAYPDSGDFSSGQTPDIRDSAYDHNVAGPGASSTVLFAIDEAQQTLVQVGPDTSPISGPTTLTTIGTGLGVAGGAFDISGETGTAYMFDYDFGAAATLHGKLHTVNLTTGVATPVGKIGTDSLRLLGMTVVPADLALGYTPPVVDPPGDQGGSGGGLGAGLLALLAGLARLRRRC